MQPLDSRPVPLGREPHVRDLLAERDFCASRAVGKAPPRPMPNAFPRSLEAIAAVLG